MENIVTVVILIVGGALLAIIVSAICGKRKLQRHKEFSRKDPHVPGSETHKALRVEIERRVERVREIKYDPLLLSHDPPAPKNEQDQYFSRMKALDHLCYLERELSKQQGVTSRVQHETLRGFLVRLTLPVPFVGGGAVLQGLDLAVLHQLCDLHAHARYHPQPFTRKHLTDTHALMLQVLTCAKSNGRKHLGSEDRLRASSDHDSAIDADPSEIEQSDDDVPSQRQQQQLVYTSLRQQQKQQHKQQQLQQQQHRQQQQQQLLNKSQPIHVKKPFHPLDKSSQFKPASIFKPASPQPSFDKFESADKFSPSADKIIHASDKSASVSIISSEVASTVSASAADVDSQSVLLLKPKLPSLSKPKKTRKRPGLLRIYDEESPDC